MASIRFGEYTRGRAPLFPVGMMLTIVYISMAHESH
jgi:hypothetical protein